MMQEGLWWVLIVILIALGTYSIFRIISIAIFRSWWEIKLFYDKFGGKDESK